MKIQGTQKVEIEVTEEMLKHITLEFIYSKLNWKLDYFIEEGKVKHNVTLHTTHTWREKVAIRKATPLDKALYTVVKELKLK